MSEVSKSTDKQIDNPQLQNVDGVTTEIGSLIIGTKTISIIQQGGSVTIRSKMSYSSNPQSQFDEMLAQGVSLECFLKNRPMTVNQMSSIKDILIEQREKNGTQEVNYQNEINMLDDRINATKNIDDQLSILQDALENFLNSNFDQDLTALKECKQRFDDARENAKVLDVDVSEYNNVFKTQIQQTINSLLSDKDKTYQHTDDQLDQAVIKWLNRANGILKLCKEIDDLVVDEDQMMKFRDQLDHQKQKQANYYERQLETRKQEWSEIKDKPDNTLDDIMGKYREICSEFNDTNLIDKVYDGCLKDYIAEFKDDVLKYGSKLADDKLRSIKSRLPSDSLEDFNVNLDGLQPAFQDLKAIGNWNCLLLAEGQEEIDIDSICKQLKNMVDTINKKLEKKCDLSQEKFEYYCKLLDICWQEIDKKDYFGDVTDLKSSILDTQLNLLKVNQNSITNEINNDSLCVSDKEKIVDQQKSRWGKLKLNYDTFAEDNNITDKKSEIDKKIRELTDWQVKMPFKGRVKTIGYLSDDAVNEQLKKLQDATSNLNNIDDWFTDQFPNLNDYEKDFVKKYIAALMVSMGKSIHGLARLENILDNQDSANNFFSSACVAALSSMKNATRGKLLPSQKKKALNNVTVFAYSGSENNIDENRYGLNANIPLGSDDSKMQTVARMISSMANCSGLNNGQIEFLKSKSAADAFEKIYTQSSEYSQYYNSLDLMKYILHSYAQGKANVDEAQQSSDTDKTIDQSVTDNTAKIIDDGHQQQTKDKKIAQENIDQFNQILAQIYKKNKSVFDTMNVNQAENKQNLSEIKNVNEGIAGDIVAEEVEMETEGGISEESEEDLEDNSENSNAVGDDKRNSEPAKADDLSNMSEVGMQDGLHNSSIDSNSDDNDE